jgi:hypothetical protein
MKLKQYLKESRSDSIEKFEAIDYIKKNCKKALDRVKKGDIIYRGMRQDSDNTYLFIDPTKGNPRVSANTSNHTTLIIDNSPKWKSYPKRSRSIICSTDKAYTHGFGNMTYIVFPYDSCTYGVCPTTDIWGSFMKTTKAYIDQFNERLDFTIKMSIDEKSIVTDKSWDSLKSFLKISSDSINLEFNRIRNMDSGIQSDDAIRKYISGITFDGVIKLYLINAFDKKEKVDMLQFVIDIIDPVKNNFSNKYKNIQSEVWIGGAPCILVDADYKSLIDII